MRWSLWSLGLVLVLFAPLRLAGATGSEDLAVRYVNGTVITFTDILERSALRRLILKRQGKVVPGETEAERKDRIAFDQESLEELTDEALMVQKAQSLKLVPDHDRVILEVLEDARRSSEEGMTLADQAHAVKIRERTESIDLLLNVYYDMRMPAVSPAQLYQAYLDHHDDFRLPPRAHVLAIVLRPTDPAVARDLQRQRADLFRRAQSAPDDRVSAPATSRLTAIIDDKTPVATRDQLTDDAIAAIAALDGQRGLDATSRALVAEAVEVRAQMASVRTMEQCLAQLTAARATLAGKDAAAFRALAAKLAPDVANGDYGWRNPGEFPTEVDQHVFHIPVGTVSEAFTSKDAAWLVFVAEREQERERTFSEVMGELEPQLYDSRREELKKRVAAVLRKSASITDVADLKDLQE